MIEKKCFICGLVFKTYHKKVKTCSTRCGYIYKGKRQIGNDWGFKKGHKVNKNRWQSKETRDKISKSMYEQYLSGERIPTKDELHSGWKGDEAGYSAIHYWIRKNKEKPEFCEHCEVKKSVDLANISGEYKRDINDYLYLCRHCHMVQDGRLEV